MLIPQSKLQQTLTKKVGDQPIDPIAAEALLALPIGYQKSQVWSLY